MRDIEDVINSIRSYISEDVGGGQARINDIIDSVNAEKDDTDPATALLPRTSNNIDDIILGQRIQEVNNFKDGRLNIDIIGDTKFNPEFNRVAKHYIAEISYVIRDNFATNTLLRAFRMERVLTDLFEKYFEIKQEAGFIKGEIESAFTPERVLLGNTKFEAIKSGIVYNLIIF